MGVQKDKQQPARRPAVPQLYPIFRRTQTGEHVKVVKRSLSPLDPTLRSFYSVDADGRFCTRRTGA